MKAHKVFLFDVARWWSLLQRKGKPPYEIGRVLVVGNRRICLANFLDNLPFINSRRLLPKRHLQAHALCRIDDGLHCCFDDSAARQLHQHVVADFVFAHVPLAQLRSCTTCSRAAMDAKAVPRSRVRCGCETPALSGPLFGLGFVLCLQVAQ
jgi:hypothetical protein